MAPTTHRYTRLLLSTLLSLGFADAIRAADALAAPPSDPPRAELHALIENVPQANARRYGSTDSLGRSMDTAKLLQDPAGGYLAVYHTYINGIPRVSVASSTDLIQWTFRRELGTYASQPHMVALPTGAYVIAWEQEPNNHLAFRYYANRTDLFNGVAARSFDAPRTLSSCAEGTPNIYSVTLSPDIDHSVIDVGAHYYWNCDRDRQQRGRLTNFRSWTTSAQGLVDNALLHWGVGGNIGDRDAMAYKGFSYGLMEGQYTKNDFGSWRSFIYDYQTGNAEPLNMRTDAGSTAFANPSFTALTAPNGQRAIAVSLFLPGEGAKPGEAGQLIYYRTY
ncbi:hypothetical protein KYC5002_32750 [Archangium violaceum]|uniref:hypothetical protein n=1 Tax=Archangium violaceum TaxID=83451 RepID=UPI002B2E1586|nr:hypothetical protein KYC5002_32750 [Archangium gephyra]